MLYTIRHFDPYTGGIQVEFPSGELSFMVLPLDINRNVPVGQELEDFIISQKPTAYPAPLPVNNYDKIQELVVSWASVTPSWEQIRQTRNMKLNDSDWTQLPDVNLTPEQSEAWRVYRQQLRDIPDQFENTADVVWPEEPAITT
jgi:hypothetical protein